MPVVVVALVVLAAPAVSGAGRSASSLRAQNAQISARSRSAVLGLYSLDQQLATAKAQLATLEAQERALRAQRIVLAKEVSLARHSASVAQRDAAQQIRALYEQGDVEPLDIVLGSKSLDEAMTNIDNLNRVAGQGEDLIKQLRSARLELVTTSKTLAERQRALAAATSRARATEASLAQARSQRASYIASLAAQRRLNDSQLAALEARAHAAQLKSTTLTQQAAVQNTALTSFTPSGIAPASEPTPPAPVTPAAPVAPVAGGRTLTVSATGYALPGTTATGLPVGWGVVAVDPSVIPLGTHMTIPGYGEGIAADTGGAIVGDTIDLWFPTVAQASAWGRRTVTIVLH